MAIREETTKELRFVSADEWPRGRYLIVDENGQGHLPIRDRNDGPDNDYLMGCAHAALTSPAGSRSKPYQGPRKAQATAKLRTAYDAKNIPWPGGAASCLCCQQPACTYPPQRTRSLAYTAKE